MESNKYSFVLEQFKRPCSNFAPQLYRKNRCKDCFFPLNEHVRTIQEDSFVVEHFKASSLQVNFTSNQPLPRRLTLPDQIKRIQRHKSAPLSVADKSKFNVELLQAQHDKDIQDEAFQNNRIIDSDLTSQEDQNKMENIENKLEENSEVENGEKFNLLNKEDTSFSLENQNNWKEINEESEIKIIEEKSENILNPNETREITESKDWAETSVENDETLNEEINQLENGQNQAQPILAMGEDDQNKDQLFVGTKEDETCKKEQEKPKLQLENRSESISEKIEKEMVEIFEKNEEKLNSDKDQKQKETKRNLEKKVSIDLPKAEQENEENRELKKKRSGSRIERKEENKEKSKVGKHSRKKSKSKLKDKITHSDFIQSIQGKKQTLFRMFTKAKLDTTASGSEDESANEENKVTAVSKEKKLRVTQEIQAQIPPSSPEIKGSFDKIQKVGKKMGIVRISMFEISITDSDRTKHGISVSFVLPPSTVLKLSNSLSPNGFIECSNDASLTDLPIIGNSNISFLIPPFTPFVYPAQIIFPVYQSTAFDDGMLFLVFYLV